MCDEIKIVNMNGILNYCPVCEYANNLKYIEKLKEIKCENCGISFDIITRKNKNPYLKKDYKLLRIKNAD